MRESCLVYCYSGIQSLFEVVLLYTFYTSSDTCTGPSTTKQAISTFWTVLSVVNLLYTNIKNSVCTFSIYFLCDFQTGFRESWEIFGKWSEVFVQNAVISMSVQLKTILHVRSILLFSLEHKIHIFSPPCNILFFYPRMSQLRRSALAHIGLKA